MTHSEAVQANFKMRKAAWEALGRDAYEEFMRERGLVLPTKKETE